MTLQAGRRTQRSAAALPRLLRHRRARGCASTAALRRRRPRRRSATRSGPAAGRARLPGGGARDLRASARAGIVVTGTEVLSGLIADRNGPWLSERLRERGVELAHIDRRRRPAGRPARGARLPHRESVDLIITSRRPRADGGRSHRRGRGRLRRARAGARRRARGAHLGDRRAPAPRLARRDEPACGPAAASRRWCRPARRSSSPWAPPPASSCRRATAAAGRSCCPGPPRELQPMWATGARRAGLRAALGRARPLEQRILRLIGSPEPEIAATLRDLEADGLALEALEITTCLRRGELEVATVFAPAAAATTPRSRRRSARATGTRCSPTTARPSTSVAARLLAGQHDRRRRVLHRRADGGPADRTRGLLRLRPRRRCRLLQRGQDRRSRTCRRAHRARTARSRPRSRPRSPTAPARASAPTSGSASPASPGRAAARRRSRSARSACVAGAGGGWTARCSSRAGGPTSATARPRSPCTCCGGCCSRGRAPARVDRPRSPRLDAARRDAPRGRSPRFARRAPIRAVWRPVAPTRRSTSPSPSSAPAPERRRRGRAARRSPAAAGRARAAARARRRACSCRRAARASLRGARATDDGVLAALQAAAERRPRGRRRLHARAPRRSAPHVTVARLRPARAPRRARSTPRRAARRSAATAVTLYRSRAAAAGARYEPLATRVVRAPTA